MECLHVVTGLAIMRWIVSLGARRHSSYFISDQAVENCYNAHLGSYDIPNERNWRQYLILGIGLTMIELLNHGFLESLRQHGLCVGLRRRPDTQ